MNLVFVQFLSLLKSITEGKKRPVLFFVFFLNINNKPLICSAAISSNSSSDANAKWLGDVVMSVLAGFFF